MYSTHIVNASEEKGHWDSKDIGIEQEMIPGRLTSAKSLPFRRLAGEEQEGQERWSQGTNQAELPVRKN